MSRGFNLTAQVNLQGPSNVRQVVSNIRRQFQGITANVNVAINPQTNRQITAINRNFQNFNSTLQNTTRYASSAATSIDQLARSVNSLASGLNVVNTGLSNVTQNANRTAQATNQTANNTNRMASEFEEFGAQAARASRRFASFAIVTGTMYRLSNAISSASKDFIEFEKELIKVAQVTNTSISGLNSLVSNISNLSTGFGVASKDLVGVSRILTQAGLSANETSIALEALAKSALAPTFDNLSRTVEGSIALMRQFGISAKDLESSLGSINAVAGKFAVEAGDIITAVSRAGGVFASASKGVSEGKDALNEFIAVFTSVRATTRESAETIATGLRTIFTRIQRGDTIDALKAYGIELQDLEGKFVGPYEAVRRLAEGLKTLDTRDIRFSRIVEDLGGFRQIGKVIPLIQQFTTAQQALSVAQRGQGSLAKDASIAQLSLANQISKVREEFSALIRSVGQSQGFQDLARLALDLTSGMIALANAAKGALPALTAIFAIKGFSALTQFSRGFFGNLGGGGQRINSGGYVRRFARGGVVPGSGNSDTVPAMLQPGEFVIRKKAVQTLGTSRLHQMNKYASGGTVSDAGSMYNVIGASYVPQKQEYSLSKKDNTAFTKKNRFNAKDRISYNFSQENIDVEKEYSNDKENPLYTSYRYADNPSKRGKIFERIVQDKFGQSYERSRNPSSYLDGILNGKLAEIKSNEKVSQLNLGRKLLAASIAGTKGKSKEPTDQEAGARLNKTSLSSRPETINLGDLTLINDITSGLGKIQKSRKIKTPKKIQQANIGGLIQKFEIGGEAKALPVTKSGKVNISAIQTATLDQLRETLKHSGLSIASRNQLNNAMQRRKLENAAPSFGLVGLRGMPFNELAKTPRSNKDVRIIGGVLPGDYAEKYEGQMGDEFVGTVQDIGKNLAVGLDAQVKSKQEITGFLQKTGFYNAVGAYLETAIAAIGAPFEKTSDNDPIDFKSGIGPIASKFGIPGNIPTDITRTVGDNKALNLRGKGKSKFLGQIENYLDLQSPQTASLGGFIQKFMAGGYAKPPSEKQLGFLKSLVSKNGVPEGLEYPPKTSQEASALINALKNPQVAPREGQTIESVFDEYKNIFGIEHEYAKHKDVPDFFGEQKQDYIRDINSTIQRFDKFARIIRTYYGKGITKSGSEFLAFGGVGQKNQTMPLDSFVSGGSFDENLLQEFYNRGKFAFGSTLNANQTTTGKKGHIGRSFQRRALGGLIQKFAEGGSAGDTVPALLTPGEFVINKKAAKRIGSSNLHKMNQADKISGFNKGGPVGHIQKFQNGGSASVSSQNTNFIALASVQQAAQRAAQAQQQAAQNLQQAAASQQTAADSQSRGGDLLNKASLAFAFIGPMLSDQIGNLVGGSQGAGIAGAAAGASTAIAVGGQLASINPIIGGLVTGVGAVVLALDGYQRAVNEKEMEMASSKIDDAVQRTEKALERFNKDAGDAGAQKDIVAGFKTVQEQEGIRAQAAAKAREPGILSNITSYATFGMYGGQEQRKPEEVAGELSAEQQAAANQASAMIDAFANANLSLVDLTNKLTEGGASLEALNLSIVEANPEYQEAIAKIQQSNMSEELKTKQIEATNKKFVDQQAAVTEGIFAEIERERASARLTRTLGILSSSMTRTFRNLNQSISVASNSLKSASDEIKNIASGSQVFNAQLKSLQTLANPQVATRGEQNAAIRQTSQFAGADRDFVEKLARFSLDAEDIVASVATQAQQAGDNPEQVASTAVTQLTSQLEAALGQNTITNEVRDQLSLSIKAALEKGGENADIQKILESTLGETIKSSQQVFDALGNSGKLLEESFNFVSSSTREYANLQKTIAQQQAFAQNVILQSNIAVKEALGGNVGLGERRASRTQVAATTAGVNPNQFNLPGLISRRNDLQTEANNLKTSLDNLTQSFDVTAPNVSQKFLVMSQRLAEVDTALQSTSAALEELPKITEQNINDIVSEIGRIQQEYEARTQAAASFGEKLVGSTPQELQQLSGTFNLLNNTLNGNVTTIQQSQAAQQAYFQAIQSGQNIFEANAAAQQAFASQTQSALGMFNELSQMSGLQGPEINAIRADLLENFAGGQGVGVENNPMFKQILEMLRRTPDQDPQIQALQTMLSGQQQQLIAETASLNQGIITRQAEILNRANQTFIQALENVQLRFDTAQLRDLGLGLSRPGVVTTRSRGGVVYASEGAYVNYQPKGTDTVPAMLTPGEFVVNAKAARQNLPLLRSINSSVGKGKTFSRGGVVYAAGGLDSQIVSALQKGNAAEFFDIEPYAVTPELMEAYDNRTRQNFRNPRNRGVVSDFSQMSGTMGQAATKTRLRRAGIIGGPTDFTTPDPDGLAPRRPTYRERFSNARQRASNFGSNAMSRGRNFGRNATNFGRNLGRTQGGNLISMSSGFVGDAVEGSLNYMGANENVSQFAGESTGLGLLAGGQYYQGLRAGAPPTVGGLGVGMILTEIGVQSLSEVGQAVFDREGYIQQRQAELDAMDPNRGFVGNFMGSVFGEDASVYRPTTWIPGRGLPSAIGRSTVGLTEGAEAGLGIHKSDYDVDAAKERSRIISEENNKDWWMQGYTTTEASWVKDMARLQIRLEEAKKAGDQNAFNSATDAINVANKSQSKPGYRSDSWFENFGIDLRGQGQNRRGFQYSAEAAVKEEQQRQRQSALAAAEAEERAKANAEDKARRDKEYAARSDRIRADQAMKDKRKKEQLEDLGLPAYATQAEIEQAQKVKDMNKDINHLRSGTRSIRAGAMSGNDWEIASQSMSQKNSFLPPDMYPEDLSKAQGHLQKLLDQAKTIENSSFDSDPFTFAADSDDIFGNAQYANKLEYEQARRRELAKLYGEIQTATTEVAKQQDTYSMIYPEEERKELWNKYEKGLEVKANIKEREERLAYNKSIDQQGKLMLEAASIMGVPMPNKGTNVSAFLNWRDKLVEKIGRKFPLTGDASTDRAILEQYGIGGNVAEALFEPFSDSEASAVYGSMLASPGTRGAEANLVRALQMNNQAISQGLEQDPKIQAMISSADPAMVQKINKKFTKTYAKNTREINTLGNLSANFANLNPAQQQIARGNIVKRLSKSGLVNLDYPEESVNRLNAFGGQGLAQFVFPKQQIQNKAIRINSRVPARRASGGMIYANNGMLVPYEPQGTDTVPAMLTPGEFVVNRQATQNNLPLLKAINRNRGGQVSYLAEGGTTDPAKFIDGVSIQTENETDKNVRNIITDNKNYVRQYNKDYKSTNNNLGSIQNGVNQTNDTFSTFRNVAGFSHGGMVYANKGMLIPYQPKGSDTVPAMLTPGEFVVNRAATQKNLPTLQAMNRGGKVSYLADGTPGSGFDFSAIFNSFSELGSILPNISNGLQQLLTTLQNNSGAGVNNNSFDPNSFATISNGLNSLAGVIGNLSIPSVINLQMSPMPPVPVVLNGAEVLGTIEPRLQELITAAIDSALTEWVDKNFDGVTYP